MRCRASTTCCLANLLCVRLWQVMRQREILPVDKAAAHALGLCMKLKDHGSFVRFKAKRLREYDLEHHKETTAAKVPR